MDRYEAERLAKRSRGICSWFNRGNDRCKFGENCKFIHSKDDVVLPSFWCKYYVAGRDCFAGEDCKYSHDATGVRCIQCFRSGMCRHGDKCVFEHNEVMGSERPPSPVTPPRDRPKKGDGGRSVSPEKLAEEEEVDFMVYDDDTRAVELLSEAVSYMSDGKNDVDRWEGEAIFKLLRFTGDEEHKNAEWNSWASHMLSPLELHEIVKAQDIPLKDIEEWTDELRIWYRKKSLEGDSKDGKKPPSQKESGDVSPAAEVVPEVSEVVVNVDEELRKAKNKRKAAATEDPYTLLVPKPKQRPANMDRSEKGGSSTKVVASNEEKVLSRTRAKTGISASKHLEKEKVQSPKKKEVAREKDSEKKGKPSDVEAQVLGAVDPQVAQSRKAIDDARREGGLSPRFRGVWWILR